MPSSKRKTWPGRVFIGRDQVGKQQFWWVGRFATRRERDDAVAAARTTKPWLAMAPHEMTCEQWAQRYLDRYERKNKTTSHQTAVQALKPFRSGFGDRPIGSIGHVEAEDWAKTTPAAGLSQVVALFNYVKSKHAIEHNPFDGLGGAAVAAAALTRTRRPSRSSSASAPRATCSATTRRRCATSSTSPR